MKRILIFASRQIFGFDLLTIALKQSLKRANKEAEIEVIEYEDPEIEIEKLEKLETTILIFEFGSFQMKLDNTLTQGFQEALEKAKKKTGHLIGFSPELAYNNEEKISEILKIPCYGLPNRKLFDEVVALIT